MKYHHDPPHAEVKDSDSSKRRDKHAMKKIKGDKLNMP